MKRILSSARLRFTRETLRTLTPHELGAVAGGASEGHGACGGSIQLACITDGPSAGTVMSRPGACSILPFTSVIYDPPESAH
jgi:hypothetical protein